MPKGKPKKEKEKAEEKFNLKEFAKDFPIKFASEIKLDPKIKTDIFALDYVLDGGISQTEGGHRIEFYGPESSGKTTACLFIIAKWQKLGKTCAFVDVEESFDPGWAEFLGVNTKKLILCQPEYLEQTGDLLVELVPKVDLIVIDSVASMIPKAELEGSLEDRNMALQAQLNSPMTRKLYHACKGQKTTMIFINQMREKVGGYGNPEHTPGGRSLKHFYNTRIKFKTTEPIEEGTKEKKVRIGVVNTLQCIKNKKGKPHRVAAMDFYYEGRIDNQKSLLYSAIKFGIIQQAGPYYSYGDIKVQGKDNFCFELKDEVWDKIEKEIWELIK